VSSRDEEIRMLCEALDYLMDRARPIVEELTGRPAAEVLPAAAGDGADTEERTDET
jgi:hypothetical protein